MSGDEGVKWDWLGFLSATEVMCSNCDDGEFGNCRFSLTEY